MNATPTFAELRRLEPRLKDLEAEAKVSTDTDWFGVEGLKAKLSALVGIRRRPRGYVAPVAQVCVAEDDDPPLIEEVLEEAVAEMTATGEALAALAPAEREREELLRSRLAHDTAYRHLYGLLRQMPEIQDADDSDCHAEEFTYE